MRVTSRNVVPPFHQGDQGGGIPLLLGVDDCDSQRRAQGDWGSGIREMRVGTHRGRSRILHSVIARG
jgi:hypothetical protein